MVTRRDDLREGDDWFALWWPYVLQKGGLVECVSAIKSGKGQYWVEYLDHSYEFVPEERVVWQKKLYWPES